MGAASHDQVQHPDPADFIDKRRGAGDQRDEQQQVTPSRRALRRRARRGVGSGGRGARSNKKTANAMLIKPAVLMVHGRPIHWISKKPLTSTPSAAPMLLVK